MKMLQRECDGRCDSEQKSTNSPPRNNQDLRREIIKLFVLILVFGVMYAGSRYLSNVVDVGVLERTVKQAGPFAPLLYMSCYLLGPTLFFPASLLSMAGGVLFGPFWGSLYTITSATLGATIPFLITRNYGRKPLERLLSKSPNFEEQFKAFEQSVEEQGWKYVAFTRLVTVFPFLLLNYAFGLTKIRLWTYVWASFLFMLPGTFMFNYVGYAGREALGGGNNVASKVSIALGCFILLSALPGLVKRLKNKKGA